MQESLPPAGGQPAKPRPSRKKKKPRIWLLYSLLAAIAVLLILFLAILPRQSSPPVRLPKLSYQSDAVTPPETKPSVQPGSPAPQVTPSPAAPSPGSRIAPSQSAFYRQTAPRGTLIFIIDDVGNNVDELRPFLSFPGALTLSILPQRTYSLDSYRMILSAGKLPMLHQPMQADGDFNPGAGAITAGMSRAKVDAVLTRNLAGMGRISWVNNHEGSKATADLQTMTYVLSYLKAHNMHFLDSRTTKKTTVEAAARSLGLPYFQRNSYFLDNTIKKADILKEIDSGLRLAQEKGYAVMIGHVWDKDLAKILTSLYPRLRSEGYRFADVLSLPAEVRAHAHSGN